MKILITGTAGFIGFHLAKKLLERGDTVVGIDNINDYYDVNLKYGRLAETGISREAEQWHIPVQSTIYPGYKFVRMNLEDQDELMRLFEREKFDKVCNLAAQAGVRYSLENPHAYISSNIVGFMNILEACRHNNIKHLAYASSSSVYGNNTKMPLSTSDNVDHPISLYAATKKSNELMAHTYSHLFNLPTTGLRFFTVYGPWGRPDMALFLFTKAILEGKPIKVFNNGNMVRDFTYIDDIIEGVIRVIDNPPSQSSPHGGVSGGLQSSPHRGDKRGASFYAIYNIGNSTPVPLIEFIDAIEHHVGKTAIKEYLPMQPGDVSRTEADVTDLVENLGYKPNTPVLDGIGKFIKWYKLYFNL
jgi:UDP-glucuronate 4-epimerase